MTTEQFSKFMDWEEKEHGKILLEVREVKHSIEALQEFRWKSMGALSVLGVFTGSLGAAILNHLLR